MDRPEPLMNENNESEKFEDGQIGTDKALDLDPQESSVDLPTMILQSPHQVTPLELPIPESQGELEGEVSFADIADVILGLFDLTEPSEEELYSSIEAEGEAESEGAVLTNCDCSSDSSNDSQEPSRYNGQSPRESEFQAELSPSTSGSSQDFPMSPIEELDFTAENIDLGNRRKGMKTPPDKGTPEYRDKRARNNVAVRRCRTKAKIRERENELRVQKLKEENDYLRRKVESQSKQLDALKNLLSESGIPLPPNFDTSIQS